MLPALINSFLILIIMRSGNREPTIRGFLLGEIRNFNQSGGFTETFETLYILTSTGTLVFLYQIVNCSPEQSWYSCSQVKTRYFGSLEFASKFQYFLKSSFLLLYHSLDESANENSSSLCDRIQSTNIGLRRQPENFTPM
jgi:hypothetical protein